MKKFLCINMIVIILLLGLSTNIFAERYSYSVGTNWGTTILPNGDTYYGDFRDLAKNSWLHYSSMSDVNAKLSSSAFSKTYLSGTWSNGLKRLNSNILFFVGHSNPNAIVFSHLGNPDYATGIYINNDMMYGDYFNTIGLNNVNMNNVELVTYVGCSTGAGNQNLLTKSRDRGADVAVRI